MFKKAFLILVMAFFAPCVLAADIKELNLDFFNRFNDEYLVQYINEAYENNHSAKQATKRVEQYRQEVKQSFSKELPTLGVSAGYLGVSVPKFNDFLDVEDNAFVLPFIANYEADFLLKNRDKTKSVKKTYEMSKLDEKTAYIALFSDVATAYTNILEYDELIKIQEEYSENLKQVVEINNKKLARGLIDDNSMNASINNLRAAETALENLVKQRDALLMEFAVLLGRPVSDKENIQRGSLKNFEYSGVIPNEIESDVIFSRPDVKRAEAALEKAKIDIRVARKEFFPKFNITGIWAFNTIAPGSCFSWESSLAAILASASQDIFTGGRKIANLKYQKAKYEELFENYAQTDLNAAKEVNTALCYIKHDAKIEEKTKEELNTEIKNLSNFEKMINQGVASRAEYLNAKNQVASKDKDLTKAKTQRLVNYYTLYKTVGGNL